MPTLNHNTYQTPNKPNEKRKKQRKTILKWAFCLFRFILRWVLFEDFDIPSDSE